MPGIYFVWNEYNLQEIAAHAVRPEEAEEVFHSGEWKSERIINDELRETYVGPTREAWMLMVVIVAYEGDLIRVVTAYPLNTRLKNRYEGGLEL